MGRNQRRLLVLAGAAVVLLAACGEEAVVGPAAETSTFFAPGGGRGGGPGGETGPAATLSFRDDGADAIKSDGSGSYEDGSERVDIALTADDFHFKPSTHKKGTRTIVVILDGQAQTLGQATDLRVNGGLCAIPTTGSTTPGRLIWFPDGTGQSMHALNFGNEDGGDPLSVTRSDDGGTSTWTVTSTGTGTYEIDGQYQSTFDLPFAVTVTGAC